MVGDSPALRKVAKRDRKAAPTNATVLLQGESGVGKELVARTIHRNSPRSRERFVQVNCAAIPEELIESELFGHEKGSFTGATERQIGKFEQADRGTIFLDEVGDMSLKTQAKVLRVLQEREVERLGSAKTIKVDVRVIAATNKNLEEEIEKGSSARICSSASTSFRSTCRRCASAATTSRCWCSISSNLLARENNLQAQAVHAGGDGRAQALSLARQHPRAAQHGRAADHHDGRATTIDAPDLPGVACGSDKGAPRPLPQRGSGGAPAPRAQASDAAARCASSRNRPSARIWSRSCARTAGTSRRPPK